MSHVSPLTTPAVAESPRTCFEIILFSGQPEAIWKSQKGGSGEEMRDSQHFSSLRKNVFLNKSQAFQANYYTANWVCSRPAKPLVTRVGGVWPEFRVNCFEEGVSGGSGINRQFTEDGGARPFDGLSTGMPCSYGRGNSPWDERKLWGRVAIGSEFRWDEAR